MKIFYSPSSNGFFHEGVQKNIPNDAFEISKAHYGSLREGISTGKVLLYLKPNKLILADAPLVVFTPEQERLWRDSELIRADIELYKVQDSDSEAKGSVSDWRNYRKALRVWPESSDFPSKEFRPKAPDAE